MRQHQQAHINIAIETYGPLPQPCYWCWEPVEFFTTRDPWGGVVHHLDHDHGNNDPDNLAFAHVACHSAYHNQGKKMSASAKKAIATAVTVWNADPTNKARKHEALKASWARGDRDHIHEAIKAKWTSEKRKEHAKRISEAKRRDPEVARRVAEREAWQALSPEERLARTAAAKSATMKARLATGIGQVDCPYGCGKRCMPGPMARHTRAGTCLPKEVVT